MLSSQAEKTASEATVKGNVTSTFSIPAFFKKNRYGTVAYAVLMMKD